MVMLHAKNAQLDARLAKWMITKLNVKNAQPIIPKVDFFSFPLYVR